MDEKPPAPGVSRANRISDEGLQRLEKQLARGMKMNPLVLAQWIRRYGAPARDMIQHHGQYSDELARMDAESSTDR